jgi:hypothetical protein
MAELDMEHYDDEEATAGGRIFGSGNPGMALYRRAAVGCLLLICPSCEFHVSAVGLRPCGAPP